MHAFIIHSQEAEAENSPPAGILIKNLEYMLRAEAGDCTGS